MKRSGLFRSSIGMVLVLLLVGSTAAVAQDIYGAREGSILGGPPPGPPPAIPEGLVLDEGFDDITNLPGWASQNNSSPLGSTDWFQGNDVVFPAQAGAPTAYLAANFNNSGSPGTISNWMMTPVLDWSTAQSVSFYTRTATGSIWPDRLEIRTSSAGSSTDVGSGVNDVGDFTNLVLSVNPSLLQGGYPEVWTFYQGALPSSGTGRIAFRYFVPDAGPSGSN